MIPAMKERIIQRNGMAVVCYYPVGYDGMMLIIDLNFARGLPQYKWSNAPILVALRSKGFIHRRARRER
jgi:hypothetical protein